VLLGGAVVLAIFMIALGLNRGGGKGVKPPPIQVAGGTAFENISPAILPRNTLLMV
jgi:hypothetical protein